MTEAIPTPFDITPIPHIPWEPGAVSWVVAVMTLLLVSAAVALWGRYGRSSRNERALRRLLRELSALQASKAGPECERFSRLARRIFSSLVGIDLAGCSPDELRRLAAATEDLEEAEALRLIAQIEEFAYAPASAPRPEPISAVSARVTAAIKAYAGSLEKR